MILVTFAMPFESADFRRRPIAKKVRIVHTGVGEEAARVALELAVCEELPSLVVASGFAGGLREEHAIGNLLVQGSPAPAGFSTARFGTSREVLATSEAKRSFREATGADAVEMEGQGIRQVCEAAGVPLLIARAVSDRLEDDLGLPPEQLARLSAHPIREMPGLVLTLLRSAERRRNFLRMVRDCRKAQAALGEGLERLLLLLQEGDPVGR